MKPIEPAEWNDYCAFRERVWTHPNGKREALDKLMATGGYRDFQELVDEIINPLLVEIQRNDFDPLLRELGLTIGQRAKQLKETICGILLERGKGLAVAINDESESRKSQEWHTKVYAALNEAVEWHLKDNPSISKPLPEYPKRRIFAIYLGYELLIACLYRLGPINFKEDLKFFPKNRIFSAITSISENLWHGLKTSGANKATFKPASGADNEPRAHALAKLRRAIVALANAETTCAKRVWVALYLKNHFLREKAKEPVSGKVGNKAILMKLLNHGMEYFEDGHPYCVGVEDFDRYPGPLGIPQAGSPPKDPAQRENRLRQAYCQYGQDFLEALRQSPGNEPDRWVDAFLALPLRKPNNRHPDAPLNRPTFNQMKSIRNLLYRAGTPVLCDIVQKFGL